METRVLFSSNSDEWSTPQETFDALDAEFRFTLDPCASDENHKTPLYCTKENSGLDAEWGGQTVFCNPPYSQIGRWVRKAYEEGRKPKTTIVMLIPARTDTAYFHDYIYHRAEIRFIRGRLRFSGAQYNAPFPSMIVIFRGVGE